MEDKFMNNKNLVLNTPTCYWIKSEVDDYEVELDKILYDELTLGKSLYKIDCTGRMTRLNPNTDFIVQYRKPNEYLAERNASDRYKEIFKRSTESKDNGISIFKD